MSKIDVGVGDEFPLDESRDDCRGFREEHRRWHHHHHGRHRGHGFGRLAFLLVIAGTVALIVEHQLTRTVALGMIGTGVGLWVLMFVLHALWHRRHHRHITGQVS
jgi:hypothetical protein